MVLLCCCCCCSTTHTDLFIEPYYHPKTMQANVFIDIQLKWIVIYCRELILTVVLLLLIPRMHSSVCPFTRDAFSIILYCFLFLFLSLSFFWSHYFEHWELSWLHCFCLHTLSTYYFWSMNLSRNDTRKGNHFVMLSPLPSSEPAWGCDQVAHMRTKCCYVRLCAFVFPLIFISHCLFVYLCACVCVL